MFYKDSNHECICTLKAESSAKGNVLLGHLIALGPLIYGVKPIHLLCFSKGKESAKKLIEAYKLFLKGTKGICLKEIPCENGSYKLLFFNPKLINTLLIEKANIEFLASMGHKTFEENYYIEFFSKELSKGNIPHEIGLFFGYPLKDVKGFIGMSNLCRIATCGWQVYGEKASSEKIYISFLKAKKKMKMRLMNVQKGFENNLQMELIELI